MRGDTVYRVYGRHEGREKDTCFGTFADRPSAEAEAAKLALREPWASEYHNLGFAVVPHIVDTDFVIPSLPVPREEYFVETQEHKSPGVWPTTTVRVHKRGMSDPVAVYERNYLMLSTFEPFRQGSRRFALISPDYVSAAVLDLESGEVVAQEQEPGFCPVGFYVPDWWDIHCLNGRHDIPGSNYWNADSEWWPDGSFGFVWGCFWADDYFSKVQLLDLSRVRDGVIRREERFGYLPVDTRGYLSPCLDPDFIPAEFPKEPPPFIHLYRNPGRTVVRFTAIREYNFDTAEEIDPLE